MNAEKSAQLNKVIADCFEVNVGVITPDTSFIKDLDASSLKRTVFVAELEELTGSTISVARIKKMETVSSLYEQLNEWLQ